MASNPWNPISSSTSPDPTPAQSDPIESRPGAEPVSDKVTVATYTPLPRDNPQTIDPSHIEQDTVDAQETNRGASIKGFTSDFDAWDVPLAPLNMVSNLLFGNTTPDGEGGTSGFPGLLGSLNIGPDAQRRAFDAKSQFLNTMSKKGEMEVLRSLRGVQLTPDDKREMEVRENMDRLILQAEGDTFASGRDSDPYEVEKKAETPLSTLGSIFFRSQNESAEKYNEEHAARMAKSAYMGDLKEAQGNWLKERDKVIGHRENELDNTRADKDLDLRGAQHGLASSKFEYQKEKDVRDEEFREKDYLLRGKAHTDSVSENMIDNERADKQLARLEERDDVQDQQNDDQSRRWVIDKYMDVLKMNQDGMALTDQDNEFIKIMNQAMKDGDELEDVALGWAKATGWSDEEVSAYFTQRTGQPMQFENGTFSESLSFPSGIKMPGKSRNVAGLQGLQELLQAEASQQGFSLPDPSRVQSTTPSAGISVEQMIADRQSMSPIEFIQKYGSGN